MLAKAVAGEAKVPFFSISGSDFVEMFAQAIEKAGERHYDLVFMDVRLPDIPGMEVTRQIRAFTDP